ncbi:hypothetical protein [uncultured Chitinophaga sp.]|uniref:hypothetical protein n=1 Tax=uncultured Chitinophaga sp. TaxID=339340 RepID=UPI002625D271|nr:hypothetical protein [uncultured Chitinophaga sp.]
MLIVFFVAGVLLVIVSSRLVFVKKQIYYGWIDQSKKITIFDFVTNFDGRWIFKSIDYNFLLRKFSEDAGLQTKINEARLLDKACIGLALLMLVSMISVKIFD